MRVEEIELRQIRMRLKHPFETSFGITQDRRILIVRVRSGALEGYGEVTAAEGPAFSYETTETAWHILADFVIPFVLGRELDHATDFPSAVASLRGHPMAKAGLENALWDLEARLAGQPLWKLVGGSREQIECGVSIGIQPSVDQLLEKIDIETDAGYKRIKIKIKPGMDLEIVRLVRAAFPDISLMVDANAAYTLADLNLFRKLDRFGLMMIEQPFHWNDLIDHAELQKVIETPVCLDESIRSADDTRKAIQIGACRIINVKLGRVGGHSEARAIHDVAKNHGIPVWCGGMLESGIGRAHNVALSSLDNFSLPGDVSASKRYWLEDLIVPPVEVAKDGTITQSSAAGIGFTVREDFIAGITERCQSNPA